MKSWMVAVVFVAGIVPCAQSAIIFGGDTGHTTAPADDPGWNRIGRCGSTISGNSGIYMGSGWVLTANHGASKSSFTVDGDQTYSLIAGSGQQIAGQDLYLFRVTVPESSLLDGLGQLAIVDNRPTAGTLGVHIGTGVGQTSDSITATDWQKNGTWSESTRGNPNPYVAVVWNSTRDTRWNSQAVSTGMSWGPSYFATAFDGTDGYGMVSDKDSGSGFFVKNGGTWELAGLALTVSPGDTYAGGDDRPARYADSWTMMAPTEGDEVHSYSGYLDLSAYSGQITTAMGIPGPGPLSFPEPATLSLLACGAVAGLKRRRKR